MATPIDYLCGSIGLLAHEIILQCQYSTGPGPFGVYRVHGHAHLLLHATHRPCRVLAGVLGLVADAARSAGAELLVAERDDREDRIRIRGDVPVDRPDAAEDELLVD